MRSTETKGSDMYKVRIRSIDGCSSEEYAEFFDAIKAFAELTGQTVRDATEAWHRRDDDAVLTWEGAGSEEFGTEHYVDLHNRPY